MRTFAGSKPHARTRFPSRPLALLPGPYLRRRTSAADAKAVVRLNGAQLDADAQASLSEHLARLLSRPLPQWAQHL